MNLMSVPELVVVTLGLSLIAVITLLWILSIQFPTLLGLVRRHARQLWARFSRRRNRIIADPERLRKAARRIEGGVLYFD